MDNSVAGSLAQQLVAEAMRRASDPGAFAKGESGSPSRFAVTLVQLMVDAGASPLDEAVPGTQSAGGILRGAYRLPDGSVCAVYDNRYEEGQGADVVHYENGRFAGICKQGDIGALSNMLAALLTEDGQAHFAVPEALANHPFNELGDVVGVDPAGNALVVNERGQFPIPGSPEELTETIEHGERSIARFAKELGVSQSEVLEEVGDHLELLQQARSIAQRQRARENERVRETESGFPKP